MAPRLRALLGWLALLLAAAPAANAAPRVATAASAGRSFAAAARSVDAGGRLTVTGLRLEGQAADATLELQRLEVWDPAAQVVVHPGGGAPPTTQGPPDTRYFKGSVAGVPGSTAVLAVDGSGGVNGLATHGKERWALGRPAPSPVAAAAGVAPVGLSSRKAAPSTNGTASKGHRCLGIKRRSDSPRQAQPAQQASSQDSAVRQLLAASPLKASLALETDGELYRLVGGSTAALVKYVSQLIALGSTVFTKEIGVELRIVWLSVYPDPASDPWPAINSDAGQLLDALQNRWTDPANGRTAIRRTLVHLLSGQTLKEGVAYFESLCSWHEYGGEGSGDFGVSAGFTGMLDWNGNPADYPTVPVWDLSTMLHEMGHQFGSEHTHNYCTVTPDDPTTIDDCVPSETRCPQAQVGVLPSCTATPGYAGGAGTLMSYCDMLRDRDTDVSLTFGLNHPCGRRPGRVVAAIRKYVQSRAADYPACFTATVPAPPPVPIQSPNGKWSAPFVVPAALPFTSAVIDKYWTTGIPGSCPADPATNRHVQVFRWFASWTYDNANVTVSSCGRLQNGATPTLAVRSSPNSNNLGPYTCVVGGRANCPSPSQKAFTATFTAAGDTFYYFIIGADPILALKPKLTFTAKAVLGSPRGSWANPVAVPVDPNGGNVRTLWMSGEFKSFVPSGLPATLCNDGSNSRPFFAFKWFSGAALKNGTAWRATSKLTLSSCGHTATNRPAVSVRRSKNLANPSAGPFTCISRKADGCSAGVNGFKLDVPVAANTHYWFVLTAFDAAKPPPKFRLTVQLSY